MKLSRKYKPGHGGGKNKATCQYVTDKVRDKNRTLAFSPIFTRLEVLSPSTFVEAKKETRGILWAGINWASNGSSHPSYLQTQDMQEHYGERTLKRLR